MHDTIASPGKIKRKLFNGKLNACFSIFLALSFPRRSIGIRAHARPAGGPYTTSALKLKKHTSRSKKKNQYDNYCVLKKKNYCHATESQKSTIACNELPMETITCFKQDSDRHSFSHTSAVQCSFSIIFKNYT